ncbi:MAG: hypothetical protein KGH64_02035 [Candidatus Micrarchaeota archaeon]|nr:hypothetical protein [Candidatus Micrarchaeota archaeon]MDE1834096.1 hypothetical protein [Candidatus Micrarchaeota archaeon]MDE1859736.1 hypothetical protein [Candidatus Micrarchaeota archaeon]
MGPYANGITGSFYGFTSSNSSRAVVAGGDLYHVLFTDTQLVCVLKADLKTDVDKDYDSSKSSFKQKPWVNYWDTDDWWIKLKEHVSGKLVVLGPDYSESEDNVLKADIKIDYNKINSIQITKYGSNSNKIIYFNSGLLNINSCNFVFYGAMFNDIKKLIQNTKLSVKLKE